MNYKWYLFVLQSLVKVTSNFLGIIVIKPLTIDKINKKFTLSTIFMAQSKLLCTYIITTHVYNCRSYSSEFSINASEFCSY